VVVFGWLKCGFGDVSMLVCDLVVFQLWPVFCSSSDISCVFFLFVGSVLAFVPLIWFSGQVV
jgi:hypothetical protein